MGELVTTLEQAYKDWALALSLLLGAADGKDGRPSSSVAVV